MTAGNKEKSRNVKGRKRCAKRESSPLPRSLSRRGKEEKKNRQESRKTRHLGKKKREGEEKEI